MRRCGKFHNGFNQRNLRKMIFFSDIHLLSVKPIATCSGILFWVLIIALLFPSVRKLFSANIPLKTSPSGGYLDGFDTLRGFAALFVVLTHSWHWTYPIFADAQSSIPPLEFIGNKAVPIFTMLCGYLIYRSLMNTDLTVPNLQKYFLRRFFRIYPLYVVSVVLFCILSTTYFTQENYTSISFILSDLFMTRMLWFPMLGNPVTWSLYVEIVFYLLVPLFVLCVPRKHAFPILIMTFLILVIADQGQCPRILFMEIFFCGNHCVRITT